MAKSEPGSGWGHKVGVVGVAAEVQDLQGDAPTSFVNGVGDDAVLRRFLRRRELRATWIRPRLIVGCDPARHDQRHTTAGTLGVKRSHPIEAVLGFLQPDVHGTHEHSVRRCDESKVERASKLR